MHGYFEVVLLPKLRLGLSRVAEFEAIQFEWVERDAVTLVKTAELVTAGVFNSASKRVIVGYAEEAGARILSVGGRLCSKLFRSNVLGVILLVSGWL